MSKDHEEFGAAFERELHGHGLAVSLCEGGVRVDGKDTWPMHSLGCLVALWLGLQRGEQMAVVTKEVVLQMQRERMEREHWERVTVEHQQEMADLEERRIANERDPFAR